MHAGGLCDSFGSRSSSAREGLVWRLGPANAEPLWRQRSLPHLMCSGMPLLLFLLPCSMT